MKSKSHKLLNKGFLALTLVMAIGFSAACKKEAGAMDSLVTKGTWHYKMTVVVETPEGLKTGSAVREMSNSYSKIRIDLPQSTNPAKLVGEAVVVDLAERGKLFALLKGNRYDVNHAHHIVYQYFGGGTNAAGIKALANLKDVKRTIDPNDYPMFVTFVNLNDPKSVKKVLEMEPDATPGTHGKYNLTADHTEEFFGKGVKIKEVNIEMVDEPVTQAILANLRWIPERSRQRGNIGGNTEWPYDDPSKTYLTIGDFTVGGQY